MMKACTICGKLKNEFAFSWESAKHKKRLPACITCHNTANRMRRKKNPAHARQLQLRAYRKYRYGLSTEQYEAMQKVQHNRCAICGQPETAILKGKPRQLCVDHNHTTKKTRALLCNKCNLGLGRFDDDPERLEKAAKYLRHYK